MRQRIVFYLGPVLVGNGLTCCGTLCLLLLSACSTQLNSNPLDTMETEITARANIQKRNASDEMATGQNQNDSNTGFGLAEAQNLPIASTPKGSILQIREKLVVSIIDGRIFTGVQEEQAEGLHCFLTTNDSHDSQDSQQAVAQVPGNRLYLVESINLRKRQLDSNHLEAILKLVDSTHAHSLILSVSYAEATIAEIEKSCFSGRARFRIPVKIYRKPASEHTPQIPPIHAGPQGLPDEAKLESF